MSSHFEKFPQYHLPIYFVLFVLSLCNFYYLNIAYIGSIWLIYLSSIFYCCILLFSFLGHFLIFLYNHFSEFFSTAPIYIFSLLPRALIPSYPLFISILFLLKKKKVVSSYFSRKVNNNFKILYFYPLHAFLWVPLLFVLASVFYKEICLKEICSSLAVQVQLQVRHWTANCTWVVFAPLIMPVGYDGRRTGLFFLFPMGPQRTACFHLTEYKLVQLWKIWCTDNLCLNAGSTQRFCLYNGAKVICIQ